MFKILKTIRYFCLTQTINRDTKKISKFQLKSFSDQVRLEVHAGKGGNGVITYFTDKTIRRGKPDGGDGGAGGNIIVQAHQALHDLSHLRRKNVHGVEGQNGGAKGKNGKNGGKTIIRVPCGTLVYEIKSQEQVQKKKFLVDLSQNKKQFIVAKGGHYGKGNQLNISITSDDRFGGLGQQKIIFLQLKILADIGLVGLPNIGKSTFLAAVSRALPKIANYQFTTLKPSVGYVKFVDDFKMTIADIPGIIQDAHKDKGLGFQFLRHIQRTKILIIMLDITKPDPIKQYKLLLNQLKEYKNGILLNKPRVVIFNKKDCIVNSEKLYQNWQKQLQQLNQQQENKQKQKSYLIAAKQGDNVGQVLVQLRRIVELQREKQAMEINRQQMNKKSGQKFL